MEQKNDHFRDDQLLFGQKKEGGGGGQLYTNRGSCLKVIFVFAPFCEIYE